MSASGKAMTARTRAKLLLARARRLSRQDGVILLTIEGDPEIRKLGLGLRMASNRQAMIGGDHFYARKHPASPLHREAFIGGRAHGDAGTPIKSELAWNDLEEPAHHAITWRQRGQLATQSPPSLTSSAGLRGLRVHSYARPGRQLSGSKILQLAGQEAVEVAASTIQAQCAQRRRARQVRSVATRISPRRG